MEHKVNGQILKRFREIHGLTQRDFAETLELPPRTVENWEYRGIPFHTFRLIKIIFAMAEAEIDRRNEHITITEKERRAQEKIYIMAYSEYL